MFGIGKSEEERRREKERKKRGMRKYGQSYLKPSRRGSISCWCTGSDSGRMYFICIPFQGESGRDCGRTFSGILCD